MVHGIGRCTKGAWVSEAILAHTPPPPPPNVDPLEPIVGDKPKTTIRAKLEAHATDRNCVSCHSKIDPLGLAFENFDAIGRWRIERVQGGRGRLPAGGRLWQAARRPHLCELAEFKKLLAADERLAGAFLEQLATHALRRVMTVDDMEAIHSIAKATRDEGHGVKTLVRQLILSDLFQKR